MKQQAAFAGEEPLDVHVFIGADASFVWYEDAGDGYGYEAGECARVTINWDDAAGVLRIAERIGSFAGMAVSRTINLKLHTPAGCEERTIPYDGSVVVVLKKEFL